MAKKKEMMEAFVKTQDSIATNFQPKLIKAINEAEQLKSTFVLSNWTDRQIDRSWMERLIVPFDTEEQLLREKEHQATLLLFYSAQNEAERWRNLVKGVEEERDAAKAQVKQAQAKMKKFEQQVKVIVWQSKK